MRVATAVASRKGIEPLTPGLGNLCSILLSYREAAGAGTVRPAQAYGPNRPRLQGAGTNLAARTVSPSLADSMHVAGADSRTRDGNLQHSCGFS